MGEWMKGDLKVRRILLLVGLLAVLGVFLMAAEVFSQGQSRPITNEDARALLDEMRRDHATMSEGFFGKVNVWFVGIGGSIVGSLIVVIKLLWSYLNKGHKQQQEIMEARLREAREDAAAREKILAHLEEEIRCNMESRVKYQKALEHLVGVIAGLKKNCEGTWARMADLAAQPPPPASGPGQQDG